MSKKLLSTLRGISGFLTGSNMLPSRFEYILTNIANLAVKTVSDEAELGLMENFETENRVLFHYYLPKAGKDVVVQFVYGKTGSCYFVKSMEIK